LARRVLVGFQLTSLIVAGCIEPAGAQQSASYRYTLSKSSIRCLNDNKVSIASMTSSPILLDISLCPPRGVGIDSLVDVRASAAPTGNIGFNKSGPDSLLVIPKAGMSCFFAIIEKAANADGEIVTVDFSPCAKQP
jgi:hypothetical protein